MSHPTIEEKKIRMPSPKAKHWLLGNVGIMVKDVLSYFQNTKDEVGDIAWLTFPLAKLCIIYNPEQVKYVVQENNKNYLKGNALRFLRPLLGRGLLTSEGDFWRSQRRLIQPAFHKERLAQMVQTMVDCSQEMVNEWKQKYKDGDTVNITKEMNMVTLKIVTACLFRSEVGNDFEVINKNLNYLMGRITKRIRNPFMLSLKYPTLGNVREKNSIKALNKVIEDIITNRRKQKEEDRQGDLLDMLLEMKDEDKGEGMSDKQLMDEIMTIFLAGHETTANAMTYLWILLSENQPENEKFLEETQTVLEGGQPTFENLRYLNYCKQVIQESLRLYPPAYAFERRTIQEDQLGEYTIPANTNVIVPVYVIHHDERFWEEPYKFIPERFDPEKSKDQIKYSFFPFGGGPRLCIGEQFAYFEMQILSSLMRQSFRLEKPENFTMKLDPLVTLRTKKDIFLKIYHNS